MGQHLGGSFVASMHLSAVMEMDQRPCGQCLGWAHSPTSVEKILGNQFSACAECDDQAVMRVVVQQYVLHQPRWWVVDGTQIVPIWVLDLLKKKFIF